MAKNYYRSPGPKYNAPTTVGYEKTDLRLPRAPAYSLGRLLRPKQTSFRVPGPKYDVSNTTRHGLITMAGVSIASKHRRQHTTRTPGPAAYNTVQCMPVIKPAVPMYSIGTKPGGRKKSTVTPAPNAYRVATTIGNRAADLPSAPVYTMSGRYAKPGGRNGRATAAAFASPGPARYPAVRVDRFKPCTPRPVMFGRPREQRRGKLRTPAPNAYLPGPVSRYANAPRFTIVGRIPRRADPYYTAVDKVPFWE